MALRLAVLVMAIAAIAGQTRAQNTSIEGTLIDGRGQPLKGAEIRIQPYDAHSQGFGLRTDADGSFSIKTLAPATYRLTIRVDGTDVFVTNNIRTRPGDPWRIDYNMRHGLVTISTAHSKKIRRFAWQGQRTGSQIEGRWVETTSQNGYEAENERVESKSAAAIRRMSFDGAGNVPPGH